MHSATPAAGPPPAGDQAAIIVMGVSGSGKSTVARALGARLHAEVLEGDDYHSPANIQKLTSGIPLGDADRWPWLDSLAAEIAARSRGGRQIVCTCSALKRRYRDRLRTGAGVPIVFVWLKADVDVLQQRLARRIGHFMSPALLDSQLQTLEPLTPDEDGLTIDVDGDVGVIVERIVGWLSDRRAGAKERRS